MLRFEGGLVLLFLALDVFCVIDVIQAREDEVRNLPKIAWLLLILIFTPIGAIAWLAAGRPQGTVSRSRYERPATAYPEYDRPGRAAGVTAESDDEFLRRVRERAEEQRRKAAEEKKRREQADQDPDPTS